jgi:predicted HAD superfamily phosphohydrolase YqeG
MSEKLMKRMDDPNNLVSQIVYTSWQYSPRINIWYILAKLFDYDNTLITIEDSDQDPTIITNVSIYYRNGPKIRIVSVIKW